MYTPTLHIRTALVLITAAALALVAARSASAGGTCHQPPTESSTPTVQLEALCFSPTVTRVDVGSDVEFVNLDAFAHNVVGHGVSWGQFADIGPGESLVVTFDTPGIHPFSCTLHPGMVGAVLGRYHVWQARKNIVGAALKRLSADDCKAMIRQCARIDRLCKGRATGNVWDELLQLTLRLAGKDIMPGPAVMEQAC